MKNLFRSVGVLMGVIVLLTSLAGFVTAAVSTGQEDVIRDDSGEVPPNPSFYPIGNAENETVCPVVGMGNAVILQPPSTGGRFTTLGLNVSFFVLRHIVQACQPPGSEGSSCDHLWIAEVSNPDRRGSFYIRYVSSDARIVDVYISYGPEGITFIGDTLPSDSTPIVITRRGLEFELRIRNFRSTNFQMNNPTSTVCESIDGSDFHQSTLLEASANRPVSGCIHAISNTGAGGYSIPFTINVTPVAGEDAVIAGEDAVMITPRLIRITFGACNKTHWLQSETLSIQGSGYTTDDATTISTPEPGYSGSYPVPTPTITTTTITTTAITTTTSSDLVTQSPVSTDITSQPSAKISHSIIIFISVLGSVIILIVAPVILGVCIVTIMYTKSYKYKNGSIDLEKQNSPPVEDVTDINSKDLNTVLAISSSHNVSKKEIDDTSNHGSGDDASNLKASEYVDSGSNLNASKEGTKVLHKKSSHKNELFYRPDSFSECESDGSDVALIRDIIIATGEKVVEELTVRLSSEATNARLDVISNQTKQNGASINYISEHVDMSNIMNDTEL